MTKKRQVEIEIELSPDTAAALDAIVARGTLGKDRRRVAEALLLMGLRDEVMPEKKPKRRKA